MREISEERRKMEGRIIEFCRRQNNGGRYCMECKYVNASCPFNAVKHKSDREIQAMYDQIVQIVDAKIDGQTAKTDNQTAKTDAGKLQLTLVPRQIIRDIAEVRMYGNAKYPEGGPENWRQVEVQRYKDALLRHLLKYLDDPLSVDEESGLLHRQHMECNMAFIAELEKERQNNGKKEG